MARRCCLGAPPPAIFRSRLEAAGTPRSERAARIEALLAKVGLPHHADKYPSQMSGGMQQRLQIARCLAQEPAALMMDEPFGALDAMTRQDLQDEMLAIAGDDRRDHPLRHA